MEKDESMEAYEEAVKRITPGIYRHFKGNFYEVLCIAKHSETTEPMVVYRALYGDGGVWVRPAAMWFETVERDGKCYQRFRKPDTEERVRFYEQLYDELRAAKDLQAGEQKQKLSLLERYYTSGEWQADYEADEQGLLPAGLKRGVLSQDAVYDLLEDAAGHLES